MKLSFGKFGAGFQRQPLTDIFQNRCSQKLPEPFLIKLQAFFHRTPAVAVSVFSRPQISFSAKSGMHWRQLHRFLSRTPLKIRVKPQKQPLQLFCKKGVLRNFVNFIGKHLYQSLFLIELQAKRLKHRCFPVEFAKFLETGIYGRLLLRDTKY